VLIFSEVPCIRKNSFHKALVKVGSRSNIMEVGMLCNLNTLAMNDRVTIAAVYGWGKEMKWLYLERRSTTTKTTE
jgi:hypothetical protein